MDSLPEQHAFLPHPFSCAACGGRNYMAWAIAAGPPNPGIHQDIVADERTGIRVLRTCADCGYSVKAAHDEVRRALLARLVTAARDLAEHQFIRPVRNGWGGLVCVECRKQQSESLAHEVWCRTGQVLRLIRDLDALGGDAMDLALRRGAESSSDVAGVAADRGGAR